MTPRLFAALALALLAGCATTKEAITGSVPPIRLESAQAVTAGDVLPVKVTLPSGEYRAAFRDRSGIYYRPAAEIIVQGKPQTDAYLFVPDDRSQPVSLWSDGAVKVFPLRPAVVISSTMK